MLSRVLEYWHTLRYWPLCWKAILRFRGYRPQAVTMRSITRWLSQFDAKDRAAVLLLLNKVVYLSEKHTEKTLVELNERLLARLNADGVPTRNIVYMQIHDPGSSSAVMLNMLRDRACLEQKGCHFVDWKDIRQLHEVTDRLEQGAIIYVDDFSATGGQFCTVRNYLAEYIVGNFSEFFLRNPAHVVHRIRRKPSTESGGCRPPVPAQAVQRIQSMPSTFPPGSESVDDMDRIGWMTCSGI